MKKYKTANDYFEGDHPRKEILLALREMAISCDLEEGIKWLQPIYMWNGKNVLSIGAFKDFITIWFHQGVFLSDPLQVLINVQEGKTVGLRHWRFTSLEDINEKMIVAYIEEAKRNSDDGLEIKPEKKGPVEMPELLQVALNNDKELAQQYNNFSVSKQNEFKEYIRNAKRAATKESRLKKIKSLIIDGIGLNDKYRSK